MKWQLPESMRWRKGPAGYFAAFHLIATAALWIFVIVHAVNMDITHDEAYSFRLIKTNYYRAMPGSANTHWLNSFFMKLFSLLFGDAPFALRLHSVISFPFFAFGIFRLSLLLRSRFMQLAFYCLVLFNPYIIDFFSLARGYCIAFTFQAWLLVALADISRQKTFDSGRWLRALLLCTLMVGGNLSYFYSVLATIALLALYLLFFPEKGYRWKNKKLRTVVTGFAILSVLTYADLMVVKYIGKDLNYGPHWDPVRSVIGSVVDGSFYFSEWPALRNIVTYATAALLALSSISVVASAIRQKTITTPLATGMLLICILSASFLLFFINDVTLLWNRTALQWYVPGMLIICSAIDERIRLRKMAAPFAAVVSLVMVFHFIRQVSSYYCREWEWSQGGRAIFSDVWRLHPPRVLVYHALGSVYYNYYTVVNKDLLQIPVIIAPNADRQDIIDSIVQRGDYIICPSGWEDNIRKAGHPYRIEHAYPHSHYQLVTVQ